MEVDIHSYKSKRVLLFPVLITDNVLDVRSIPLGLHVSCRPTQFLRFQHVRFASRDAITLFAAKGVLRGYIRTAGYPIQRKHMPPVRVRDARSPAGYSIIVSRE